MTSGKKEIINDLVKTFSIIQQLFTSSSQAVCLAQLVEHCFSTTASRVRSLVLACRIAMVGKSDKVVTPVILIVIYIPGFLPPTLTTHFKQGQHIDSAPVQVVCTDWVTVPVQYVCLYSSHKTLWQILKVFCRPVVSVTDRWTDRLNNRQNRIPMCKPGYI